jgi:hypothetical protein
MLFRAIATHLLASHGQSCLEVVVPADGRLRARKCPGRERWCLRKRLGLAESIAMWSWDHC